MDKYPDFKALRKNESDFFIEVCDRKSPVTILAPHGGNIEPHTSEIARLIAAKSYNYYCFNGTRSSSNQDLHITSHRYDEEQAIALLKKSAIVVAVHGCREKQAIIYLGGRDDSLRYRIAQRLEKQNIRCMQTLPAWPISGTSRQNICNRGIHGKGVQLEISRPLRDSEDDWKLIAASVRQAIQDEQTIDARKPDNIQIIPSFLERGS